MRPGDAMTLPAVTAKEVGLASTRGALAGPRVLLRKLREVMAEPIGAQERLDKIVRLIASNMVAEVCSVYVLRADNVLELYATEGLKPTSVHRATLTVGRGRVGLIAEEARPLNLPDAQSHPAFAYGHVFARNDEELVCASLDSTGHMQGVHRSEPAS